MRARLVQATGARELTHAFLLSEDKMDKIRIGARFATVIASVGAVIIDLRLGNYASEFNLEWEDKVKETVSMIGKTDHGIPFIAKVEILPSSSGHVNAFPIAGANVHFTRWIDWARNVTEDSSYECRVERDGIKLTKRC
jgi:hypothetical protein